MIFIGNRKCMKLVKKKTCSSQPEVWSFLASSRFRWQTSSLWKASGYTGSIQSPLDNVTTIEYCRGALPCTYTPACVAVIYLIYFLIGNLSYTPCSEPSRTVLLLDVMYTTDPHHRSESYSPPWAAPFHVFLHGNNIREYGKKRPISDLILLCICILNKINGIQICI